MYIAANSGYMIACGVLRVRLVFSNRTHQEDDIDNIFLVSRVRLGGADAADGIRDAGDVLIQHRVHVHVRVVPYVHPQLSGGALFVCGSGRRTAGSAGTTLGKHLHCLKAHVKLCIKTNLRYRKKYIKE